MSVEVIIPWSPGDPHREKSFEWLRDHLPYPIHIATADPWNKARAVVDCSRCLNTEFVIVHDADVWCDDLAEAVSAVLSGIPWAIPHRYVYRLSEKATNLYLTTGELEWDYQRPPYDGVIGGGIVVLRTEVLRDCPIDPRFICWGQEDQSWGVALDTLYGHPWRGRAKLLHFYHELQPKLTSRWGSNESRVLYQTEYHRWNGNQVEMRKTIERAKAAQ